MVVMEVGTSTVVEEAVDDDDDDDDDDDVEVDVDEDPPGFTILCMNR
jgi:hypothetical protein